MAFSQVTQTTNLNLFLPFYDSLKCSHSWWHLDFCILRNLSFNSPSLPENPQSKLHKEVFSGSYRLPNNASRVVKALLTPQPYCISPASSLHLLSSFWEISSQNVPVLSHLIILHCVFHPFRISHSPQVFTYWNSTSKATCMKTFGYTLKKKLFFL